MVGVGFDISFSSSRSPASTGSLFLRVFNLLAEGSMSIVFQCLLRVSLLQVCSSCFITTGHAVRCSSFASFTARIAMLADDAKIIS